MRLCFVIERILLQDETSPMLSRVLALNLPYHLAPDLLPHIKGSCDLDYKES